MLLAYIPSPPVNEVHLGPVPIRFYALCIIAGILVAVWVGERRLVARGARPGVVADIATWAVPFGLVGGRLYHVVTDPELYFLPGRHPIDALYIWRGGLGIWGAIALGAVGAWIGARRAGVRFSTLADAVAPGIAIAQAVGRWGNWFNQELYGRPSGLPWAVKIDPVHRVLPNVATYQPTFLYESLWDLGVAALVIWADRRWKLTHGRAFFLYVAAYTVGRGWIEYLRIDHANRFLGLRLNDWTSLIVFLGAVTYLVVRRHAPTGPEPAMLEPSAEGEPDEGVPAEGATADGAPGDPAPAEGLPPGAGPPEPAAATPAPADGERRTLSP